MEQLIQIREHKEARKVILLTEGQAVQLYRGGARFEPIRPWPVLILAT